MKNNNNKINDKNNKNNNKKIKINNKNNLNNGNNNEYDGIDLSLSYFKDIMVLGCGNILFADDGFSVHVIEKLQNILPKEIKKYVSLVDAGAGAPQQVLSLMDEHTKTKKIILIDVIDYNLKPGEIKIFGMEYLPNPKHNKLDIHDWPLSRALREVCENYNIDLTVIGCQYKYISEPDVYIGLSEEVERAVDIAVNEVLKEINKCLIEYGIK